VTETVLWNTVDTRATVPVLEGAFAWFGDAPALLGSHCLACGSWAFPRTFLCPNPRCVDRRVEDAPLSKVGRLASWTVVHFPPPRPYVAEDPFVPFAIGEVEFPEGIQVIGPVTGCQPEELHAGRLMKTIVEPYYVDLEGNAVVGWKFSPVSGEPV
jgi:uncharacterized protein